MKTVVVALFALAFALLGMAVYFAPSMYEVVAVGRDLRPYESGEVYKLRLLDRLTVYASDESRPNTDTISGAALVALATAALMTSLVLRASGAARRAIAFYAIAAAGFAFLALDEFFAVHETVGHNLAFLSDLPAIERPDDLIIALYVIPAVAFLYYYRDLLTASRRAVVCFVAALGAFALAGLADFAGVSADEPLEIVAAGLIAAGFIALIAAHLAAALATPERREQPMAT